MDEDMVIDQFNQGVEAYWAGELPDGWDNSKRRERSPYLTGWYMASMWETSPGWITDMVGDSLQDDD